MVGPSESVYLTFALTAKEEERHLRNSDGKNGAQ